MTMAYLENDFIHEHGPIIYTWPWLTSLAQLKYDFITTSQLFIHDFIAY